MLIHAGSQLDVCSDEGETLMHMAAMNCDAQMIETLIRFGSKSIDVKTSTGETPLHKATIRCKKDNIQALIRFGSNSIDEPDKKGLTPLHYACTRSTSDVCDIMYLGANRNIEFTRKIRTSIYSRFPFCDLTDHVLNERLNIPYDENDAHELRYQTFFRESLVSRLLFEISRARTSHRLPCIQIE
jgi:ankyrin repeat protein